MAQQQTQIINLTDQDLIHHSLIEQSLDRGHLNVILTDAIFRQIACLGLSIRGLSLHASRCRKTLSVQESTVYPVIATSLAVKQDENRS